MEWWNRANNTMRRVWFNLSMRFRIRNSGLLKLRNDIRRCEYEDIHVMWEMLKRSETDIAARSPSRKLRRRSRPLWKMFMCASRTPYLCRRL